MSYRVELGEPYCRVWFSGKLTGADLRDVADLFREHESELGRIPDRLVNMSEMVATGATFNGNPQATGNNTTDVKKGAGKNLAGTDSTNPNTP